MTMVLDAATGAADAEQAAVAEALAPWAGRFEGFHAETLAAAARRVRSELHERALGPWFDVDSVVHQHVIDLAAALDATSIRALITVFVVAQEGNGTGYEEMATVLRTAAGRDRVLRRYPELRRVLDLRVERRERALLECVDNLSMIPEADRVRVGLGRVIRVTHSGSDTHRGGRGVLFVEGDEQRLVFKPGAGGVTAFLDAVRVCLDPGGELLGPLFPPVLAETSGGSWYAFITPSSFRADDAADYLRRFGSLLALATALGMTDLHHENVIASAAGPMLVDIETFTSVIPAVPARGRAHEELLRGIDASPLRSMLLPFRFLGLPIDLDVSALGSGARAEALTVPAWTVTGAGTDDIGFTTEDVSIPVGHRLITPEGHPIDPRAFGAEIAEGYTRMRDRVHARAERLGALIDAEAPSLVRVVARPTRVYARFLEASLHPHYLGARADRQALLSKLGSSALVLAEDAQGALREADVRSLLDLDIPYFHAADDGWLRVDDGESRRDIAVVGAPSSAMRAHLGRFLRRSLVADLAEIDLSLETSADDVWEPSAVPNAAAAPFPPRVLPAPEHRVAGTDGVTWLTAVGVGDGLRIAPLTLALYEGGGTLTAAAYEATPEHATIIDAARAAIRHSIAPEVSSPSLVSAFVGATSEEATLWDLDRAGVPVEPRPLHSAAVTAIADTDLAGFDFIGGFGGYLAALARYPSDPVDAEALRRALHRFLDTHAAALVRPEEPGLAHGMAGTITALSAADELLDGDERIRGTIDGLVAAIRADVVDLRDPVTARSWCKGYPGVLLALADARGRVSRPAEVERLCADARGALLRPREAGPVDISICHGVGGEALALHAAGEAFGDGSFDAAAQSAAERGRTAIQARQWRSGLARAPRNGSFMLGSGGWAVVEAALGGRTPVGMLGVLP